MRPDPDWLGDILDAIAVIQQFRPASRTEFDNNEPIQSHLLRQLQIIGEAAARISKVVKTNHPQVPWRQISGMRNAIIHAYFQIDWNEVWNTLVNDIPAFKPQIEAVLASLPPPDNMPDQYGK